MRLKSSSSFNFKIITLYIVNFFEERKGRSNSLCALDIFSILHNNYILSYSHKYLKIGFESSSYRERDSTRFFFV